MEKEKLHPKDGLNITKEYHDKYNTLVKPEYNYTETVVNSDLEYSPSKGQTWHSFSIEASIYAKTGQKMNERCHINTPKGPWYTHKSPGNCFMCSDQNLISVLIEVIGHMASKYPKQVF